MFIWEFQPLFWNSGLFLGNSNLYLGILAFIWDPILAGTFLELLEHSWGRGSSSSSPHPGQEGKGNFPAVPEGEQGWIGAGKGSGIEGKGLGWDGVG